MTTKHVTDSVKKTEEVIWRSGYRFNEIDPGAARNRIYNGPIVPALPGNMNCVQFTMALDDWYEENRFFLPERPANPTPPAVVGITQRGRFTTRVVVPSPDNGLTVERRRFTTRVVPIHSTEQSTHGNLSHSSMPSSSGSSHWSSESSSNQINNGYQSYPAPHRPPLSLHDDFCDCFKCVH